MENVLNAFENKQINTTEARTTVGGEAIRSATCEKWKGKGRTIVVRGRSVNELKTKCNRFNGILGQVRR